MQDGQNWILPKEIANIWKNQLCLSMGPNGGSATFASEMIVLKTIGLVRQKQFLTKEIWIRPMISSATSTSGQSVSCIAWGGRFHPNQFKTTTYYPPAIMECRLCFQLFQQWHMWGNKTTRKKQWPLPVQCSTIALRGKVMRALEINGREENWNSKLDFGRGMFIEGGMQFVHFRERKFLCFSSN
jgi:hypothetical protein